MPGDPSKPYEQPELERAAKTWRGDTYRRIGGGGTVWDGMAYDPELDTIFVGTGNGNPWNQGIRSPGGGDNLFLASIVALDPNTGKTDSSMCWTRRRASCCPRRSTRH